MSRGIWTNLFAGSKKNSEEIAKNKRCYANTLRPRSRMLLKVMKGACRRSAASLSAGVRPTLTAHAQRPQLTEADIRPLDGNSRFETRSRPSDCRTPAR
jgi:hypothetical protein